MITKQLLKKFPKAQLNIVSSYIKYYPKYTLAASNTIKHDASIYGWNDDTTNAIIYTISINTFRK